MSQHFAFETAPQAETVATVYASDLQLGARYGVNRGTIWRWARNPSLGFPQPVRVGGGSTRWLLAEIEAFDQQQRERQRSA